MKQSSLDFCVWCTILSCTCYFPCFWGEFVYDDIVAVQNNPDVRSETGLKGVIELFVHDFWGGSLWVNTWSHLSYRPLTVLSFRLNYSFHGLHVLGYHIVNVVLHSAVCVKVGVLAKKLEKYFMNLEEQQPSKKQWCSALLFCVHPVCSEAVANIVGRAEILSAFLSISALISFLDVDMRASTSKKDKLQAYIRICVLCMAAVLSKESGLTAPLLMLSIPIARYLTAPKSLLDKPLWQRSVFPLCLGAILFWGRMWFTTGYSLVMSQRFNPIHELPMGIYKLASIGYIQAYAVSLLVMPWILCHTHSSFPLIRALWDLRNLMTLIFFSLVLWFVYYSVSRKRPFMLFSLLWIGCSFLPASHVFFRVGFVIAERTLYVPAIGFVFFLLSFSGLDDEEANFWVTFEGNLKTVICQKNEKSLFNQECSSSSMQHVSELAMFVGKHIQTEESLQSSRWRGPTARRRVRKGGGGGGGGRPPCKVNPPCPLGFARRRRLLWCLGAAAWARARRRAHAWASPEPLYASALRTYPGDAGVLHALGHRALFSSSVSDKYNLAVAMEYLSRAVNARSDHGTAWGQLGRAFHLQGDYPQALACARAAAKAGASEYLTNAGAAQIAISGTLNGSLSAFQAARRNSLSDNDPRNSNVENNFGAIQLAVLCGSGISFQEILESSFAAKAVTEAKKSFIKAQQLQLKVTNCSYELAVVFSNLSIAEMLRCEGLASAILWNQKAIDLFYQIMASSGSRKPSPLDTSYGQKKAKLHSARESDSSYEFSLSKALEVQSVLENLGHCQQQQGQNSDQGTAVCTNSNNSHVVDCTLFGSLDWLGPMLQLVIL